MKVALLLVLKTLAPDLILEVLKTVIKPEKVKNLDGAIVILEGILERLRAFKEPGSPQDLI